MSSTVARFPLDDLLRKHGWSVAARPAGREALWGKRGVVLPESEALAAVPMEQLEAALEEQQRRVPWE